MRGAKSEDSRGHQDTRSPMLEKKNRQPKAYLPCRESCGRAKHAFDTLCRHDRDRYVHGGQGARQRAPAWH